MLVLHLAACAFMVGVIWLIQLLHYPAFHNVGESKFTEFHQVHSTRMGWIVGPMMVFELLSGLILVYQSDYELRLLLNFAGIVLIWISTFGISVPIHNSLAQGQNTDLIDRLVRTNWPRTLLWTLRLLLLLWVAV